MPDFVITPVTNVGQAIGLRDFGSYRRACGGETPHAQDAKPLAKRIKSSRNGGFQLSACLQLDVAPVSLIYSETPCWWLSYVGLTYFCTLQRLKPSWVGCSERFSISFRARWMRLFGAIRRVFGWPTCDRSGIQYPRDRLRSRLESERLCEIFDGFSPLENLP